MECLPNIEQRVAYKDDKIIAVLEDLDRTFNWTVLQAYGHRCRLEQDSTHASHKGLEFLRWQNLSRNQTNIGCTEPLQDIFRAGTRPFQAINILLGGLGEYSKYARPPDYLDDLESYFYLIARICCTYTTPGISRELPQQLVSWEDEDSKKAAEMKLAFLSFPNRHLISYFQSISKMFQSMAEFLLAHALRKQKEYNLLIGSCTDDGPRNHFVSPMDVSKGHYDDFLRLINDSIDLLSPPSLLDIGGGHPANKTNLANIARPQQLN